MYIYWVLLLYCLVVYLFISTWKATKGLSYSTDSESKKDVLYFVLMSIFMIIIVGFRSKYVGIDTQSYYATYNEISRRSLKFSLDKISMEKGYIILQYIFSRLGLDFYAFNFIYAVFNVTIVSYLIYKESKIPWLSYFIYICFGFFVLELTMMRQTIAMSIVILAVLRERKSGVKGFLRYAFMILIAYSIHSSAIICLPLWFLKNVKINKKNLIIYFILIAMFYVFRNSFMIIAEKLAEMISSKYAIKLSNNRVGQNLYYVVVVSVIVVPFFINGFFGNKDNDFYFQLMCCMLIIFPLVQGGGAIMRIYYYMYVFFVVYIPKIIYAKKSDKLFRMVTIFLFVMVGLFLFNESINDNSLKFVPYEFLWNNNF